MKLKQGANFRGKEFQESQRQGEIQELISLSAAVKYNSARPQGQGTCGREVTAVLATEVEGPERDGRRTARLVRRSYLPDYLP
ncbi:unnamed protein product, partial [Nesidiocoris tenuis]